MHFEATDDADSHFWNGLLRIKLINLFSQWNWKLWTNISRCEWYIKKCFHSLSWVYHVINKLLFAILFSHRFPLVQSSHEFALAGHIQYIPGKRATSYSRCGNLWGTLCPLPPTPKHFCLFLSAYPMRWIESVKSGCLISWINWLIDRTNKWLYWINYLWNGTDLLIDGIIYLTEVIPWLNWLEECSLDQIDLIF